MICVNFKSGVTREWHACNLIRLVLGGILSATMMKFSISMFLHFCTQCVFPRYLGKFHFITKIRTHGFWTFISENLRLPLIFLVPSLGWEFEKMTSFSQKYRTGWNYNNNSCGKLHEYMSQSFCYTLWELRLIVIIINPCGIFEKMTSFSPILIQDLEQGKLMAAINSQK